MEEKKEVKNPEEGKDQKDDKTNNDANKDYHKEELARLEAKRLEEKKLLEDKIVALKRENKKLVDKPEEEQPAEPTLSEEEIDAKIQEKVEAQTAQTRQELFGDKLNELVEVKAKGNEDIAKVVLWHYENSIKQTGNIRQDVENAHAIYNQKFMQTQAEEQARANNSKDLAGKGGGAGQSMPPAGGRPLTPEEKAIVANSNLEMKDGKIVSPAKEKYRAKAARNFPGLQIDDSIVE